MVGQELAKGCQKVAERKITFSRLMYGSCHLDSALNVEIGVEYQMFVIVIFFHCSRVYNLGHLQGIIRVY